MSFVHSAVAAADDARPVKFSVAVEGEWTDNRDSTRDGTEENNFDLYVRPRVDLKHKGPRTDAGFYYVLSFRDRSDPATNQNDTLWEHDLEASVRHAVSPKVTVRAHEKFDINDDPRVERGGTTRSDLSHIINRLKGGVNYEFLEQTGVDVDGLYRIKRYDKDEQPEVVDEDELAATVTLSHRLSETLSALVLGKYTTYDFEDAPGERRDFDTILAAVGLDAMLSPNLVGKAQVGWQRADYDDPTLSDNDQPYVLVGVGGTPEQTTRLTAELKHGIRDGDAYPYASQDYTEGRVRLEWDPIAALTVAAEGTYRVSEYDDLTATTEGRPVSGDVDTTVGQVDVTYRFKERLSLTFAQRYEDVDPDAGVEEQYTRNSTRLGVNVEF